LSVNSVRKPQGLNLDPDAAWGEALWSFGVGGQLSEMTIFLWVLTPFVNNFFGELSEATFRSLDYRDSKSG
jgi:hypothetical protein